MHRTPITPALCRRVATEAAVDPTEIVAKRHGLTTYVVEAIVRFHDPAAPEPPPKKYARTNAPGDPIDPADLARIRRMLDAGASLGDVANELGIRQKEIRRAMENPHFGTRLSLRKGEQYVTGPTRCPTCDAPLRIVPCRACRIRDLLARGEKLWRDEEPAS